MNEIEKMYENAGVNEHPKIMLDEDAGVAVQSLNKYYPPFTAEKQISLIKWLSDTDYYIHNIYKTIDTKEYFIDNYYCDMHTDKFEETLAGLVNKLWQDLTDTDKVQIKEILE